MAPVGARALHSTALPLLFLCIFSFLHSTCSAQQQAARTASLPQPLPPAPAVPLDRVVLPPGFSISLYVDATFPARFFALGQVDGNITVVYVSSTRGVVTAIVDRSASGGGTQACTLLSGLDTPNGLAYDRDTAALYVAEVTRITRYDRADAAAVAGCDASLLGRAVVTDALPNQQSHANRALGIGPRDGKLYVTVAAPFNVGTCEDPFCTIHRVNKDGNGLEVFARGIRNAAGWDWHPETGDLLFAGQGRDMIGNNRPDDVLMAADRPGIDFGWPYCSWEGDGPPERRDPGPGQTFPDPDVTPPEFSNDVRPSESALEQRCSEQALPPVQALGPHVSSLGVLYWTAQPSVAPGSGGGGAAGSGGGAAAVQRWPEQYDGSVFVGERGSWNRDPPLGYRVANVRLGPDGRSAVGHTIFAEGWLNEGTGKAWGRPVGLARLPDGSMLLADDTLQVVYRISYSGRSSSARSAPPPPPVGATTWRTAGAGSAALLLMSAALACLVGGLLFS